VVLIFRTLLVILKNLFRRRIGALEETVLALRVWPSDIDLNFHLNDGRYLSLAGLGRIDYMIRTGMMRRALQRRWQPVVGGLTVRYRHEMRTFEGFTLHTRIVGWDEKWFYFEQRFEKSAALAAQVYVRGLMRSRDGSVPSADVLALVGWSQASPPLPDGIERWRQANVP
jgi:acyl-CoA thioesterase FadM